MGLPCLQLDAALITKWQALLHEHGIESHTDENEKPETIVKPSQTTVLVPFVIKKGDSVLKVIQSDCVDPTRRGLVFCTGFSTHPELFSQVKTVLIAAGAHAIR